MNLGNAGINASGKGKEQRVVGPSLCRWEEGNAKPVPPPPVVGMLLAWERVFSRRTRVCWEGSHPAKVNAQPRAARC